MSDIVMSLEDRLAEFLKQPGTFVTRAEQIFIDEIRHAAKDGVGYGWMQQVIEWEWRSKGQGAWGPEHFSAEVKRLEAMLQEVRSRFYEGTLTPQVWHEIDDALSGKGES